MTDQYIKLSDAVALAEKSGLPQVSVDELRAIRTYPAPDRDAIRADALREALSELPGKIAATTTDDGDPWPTDRPGVWTTAIGACENVARREIAAILALIPTPASPGVTAGADVAALQDPIAVHANMLRGAIAMPSVANIIHLYGSDTLRAAIASLGGGE